MQRTALVLAHRMLALTRVSEFSVLACYAWKTSLFGYVNHQVWSYHDLTSSCLQSTAATADTVPQQQGRSTSEALGQEQEGDLGASREGSQNGAAAKPANEALGAPFQDLPEGIPDHAMGFKCALARLKLYREQNAEEGDQRGCLCISTALVSLGQIPKSWTRWKLFHGTDFEIKG